MIDIIYVGGAIDDINTLGLLPIELKNFILKFNGVVCFNGGIHIRGCVNQPDWHSLAYGWKSEQAFHKTYSAITPSDIPFAEDAIGDQFIVREGRVLKVFMEDGAIQDLEMDISTFINGLEQGEQGYVPNDLLSTFLEQGGKLNAGELISVYPPLCINSSESKLSLRAIPTLDRISFLKSFYLQIKHLPEGAKVKLDVKF